MEEEKKNPDEITFKAPEALDRAKFNSDIMNRTVTKEQADEVKSVDDVIKEARKYYGKSYKDALKKIDPAYTEDNFYDYASYTSSDDVSEIAKKIDSGEAITSKEIDKMAVNSANKASESVKALKSSEALKIIESIGVSEIEAMDGFADIFMKIDEKIDNTEYTYDKLIATLNNYLATKEEPKGKELLELNAIVSSLASILNSSGFKSPSIEKEAEDFDKDIKLLISGDTGSVEGNKEKEKNKEESPEGVIKTEENKLAQSTEKENKTEEKQTKTVDEEKKSKLSAEDALLVSKSGSSVTEEPKNKVEEQKLESVVEKKEEKKEENKETPIENKPSVLSAEQKISEETKKTETAENKTEVAKNETQLTEKSENSESPIKDIFKGTIFEGLIGTIKPVENKNPEGGKEVKLENSTEPLAKTAEIKEEPKALEGNKPEEKKENSPTALETPKVSVTENKLEEVKAPVTTTEKSTEGTPKVESAVNEPAKLEAPKLETPKLETPKLETPKLETPKLEPIKPAPIEVKEGMNLAIEKPEVKPEVKKRGKIASAISKVVEKIKDKNETIPEDKGIKLTEAQKLSVKAPDVVKKEEVKESLQEPEKKPEPVKETETQGKENTEATATVKNNTTKEKEIEVVVDTKSLEEKMDHMIALLSMLNDTLQGPLLVSSNNKNFE